MINGLSHITIAVSDLKRSYAFYSKVLGLKGHVTWNSGAYLSIDETWVCLSLDSPSPAKDYSHIAWSVSESNFLELSKKIISSGAKQWKLNQSEGKSLYFFDPDNNKLEIHVGDLSDRLESLKKQPYDGLQWL